MSYDYIKRTYTFQPLVGADVRHTETGNLGVICRENKSQGHYVQVRFDGSRHPMSCHPMSLEYVNRSGSQPDASRHTSEVGS